MTTPACSKQPATTPPTTPTFASLVPSATDLVIGMGAKDRLVAVSNYEPNSAGVAALPRAGDYDTVDWELLASLHPTVMCTAISPDRQPQGFKDRAASLHIRVIDEKIDRLADIDTALDRLGTALNVQPLAAAAKLHIHAKLDAVRSSVRDQPLVTALIVVDSDGKGAVGPNNYLDDLLKIAGGTNAAAAFDTYPTLDHEQLLKLNPEVIIELLPAATPQEKQKAADVWKRLPQLQAVATGRVYPIYDEYALLPGWHVTDLAETFAECLHPQLTLSPTKVPVTARP